MEKSGKQIENATVKETLKMMRDWKLLILSVIISTRSSDKRH